jgi:ferredoxin
LKERNIPVIVMEPVKGGLLTLEIEKAAKIFKKANPDASLASWAIRYAASLSGILTVLSGMSNMEQLRDNIHTFDPLKPLNEEEYDTINEASLYYQKVNILPCTSCRYCDCPKGIDIPGILYAYRRNLIIFETNINKKMRIKRFLSDYAAFGKDKQAYRCIKCNSCTRHCPQSINIPQWMEQISNFYRRWNIFVNVYELIQIYKKNKAAFIEWRMVRGLILPLLNIDERKLVEFLRTNKKKVLYGAGEQAINIFYLLHCEFQIHIDALIYSSPGIALLSNDVLGKSFHVDVFPHEKNECAVLIAVNEVHNKEVTVFLQTQGFSHVYTVVNWDKTNEVIAAKGAAIKRN